MSYEQKDGEISIFPNRKKEKETHPDYKGSVTIDGKTYDVALWDKKAKSGLQYFGGKVSEPWKGGDKAPPQETTAPRQISSDAPFDDSIPF